MTTEGPGAIGKAVLIGQLRDHHERCGRPRLEELAGTSLKLPGLYPPPPGARCHFVPLSQAALSETLAGKRKGLPAFDWLASIVLCCQRLAFERRLLVRDPGTSSLPWWGNLRAACAALAGLPAAGGYDDPLRRRDGPCTVWLSHGQQVFVASHGPHGPILLDNAHAGDPDAVYRVAVLLGTDPARHDEAVDLLLQAAAAGHGPSIDLLDANPVSLAPAQAARRARTLAQTADASGSSVESLAFWLAACRGNPGAAARTARQYLPDIRGTGQPPN
jgi:hypothetical protein